jgi:hypothetical protein
VRQERNGEEEENPWEFWRSVLITLAIALGIRQFLVEARYIPSGSMLPGLQLQDRLLVEKLSYRNRLPRRGEESRKGRRIRRKGPRPGALAKDADREGVVRLDLRQHVNAANRTAEDTVQVVQAMDRGQGEEKLRTIRVRSGVGHRQDAHRIMTQARDEFVGKLVAGPAFARPERIPSLHHEAGHDPVELQLVEKGPPGLRPQRALGQTDEAGHRERGPEVVQLGDDHAPRRGELGVEAVGQGGVGCPAGG